MVYLCKPDIEVVKVLYCMQSEAAFLRTLHGKNKVQEAKQQRHNLPGHVFAWEVSTKRIQSEYSVETERVGQDFLRQQ